MKHLTDEEREALAQKFREIAGILNPQGGIEAQSGGSSTPGGGNGSGPPTDP